MHPSRGRRHSGAPVNTWREQRSADPARKTAVSRRAIPRPDHTERAGTDA